MLTRFRFLFHSFSGQSSNVAASRWRRKRPAPVPAAAASHRSGTPETTKPVVDQTAQTIIFCYHRLVDKVRYPGTEITPAAFEEQMVELKNRGITVIGMQDFLAWKRGEKSIPPRCAVITFDDGWKSQYEVAWPIMKKFGYTFTMFIYTEGVRRQSRRWTGDHLGTARRYARQRDRHRSALRDAPGFAEGHTIMVMEQPGEKGPKRN